MPEIKINTDEKSTINTKLITNRHADAKPSTTKTITAAAKRTAVKTTNKMKRQMSNTIASNGDATATPTTNASIVNK